MLTFATCIFNLFLLLLIFNLLRNFCNILCVGCTNFYSHQQGFHFLWLLMDTHSLWLFDNSYCNNCEMILCYDFDCISLMVLIIFYYTCWPFVCLFKKNVCSCPFLIFIFAIFFTPTIQWPLLESSNYLSLIVSSWSLLTPATPKVFEVSVVDRNAVWGLWTLVLQLRCA